MDYGHQRGTCYTNGKYAYIPIHKNASTWAIEYLTCIGWQQTNVTRVSKNCKFIVLLRPDIIKRWVSGFCEVLLAWENSKIKNDSQVREENILPLLNNRDYIDTVFKKITFECHTDLQSNALMNTPLDRIIFFNLADPLFQNTFTGFIFNKMCIPQNEYQNRSEFFNHKTPIIHKLNEYVQESEYNLALLEHFADDVKLFETVPFYNS